MVLLIDGCSSHATYLSKGNSENPRTDASTARDASGGASDAALPAVNGGSIPGVVEYACMPRQRMADDCAPWGDADAGPSIGYPQNCEVTVLELDRLTNELQSRFCFCDHFFVDYGPTWLCPD